MYNKDYYAPGEFNFICDRTGVKFKSRDMKIEHGQYGRLVVSAQHWDPPQPQLYIKSKADIQAVKNARPRPPDRFLVTS